MRFLISDPSLDENSSEGLGWVTASKNMPPPSLLKPPIPVRTGVKRSKRQASHSAKPANATPFTPVEF